MLANRSRSANHYGHRFELDADAEILFSVDNTYKITDKSSKTKPLPFNMISLSPNDLVVATVTGTNINVSRIERLKTRVILTLIL